jgi:hypothetical protein
MMARVMMMVKDFIILLCVSCCFYEGSVNLFTNSDYHTIQQKFVERDKIGER